MTGFGIGSLLTPLLAIEAGTRLAVAAVAVPHFIGTLQHFVKLRRQVDRRVLIGFGITSGMGGLAGALLHTRLSSRTLSIVFGTLLILAGVSELTGWVQRVRWGRHAAWVAGALSGILGGLVGNQGGIRAAAMLGFDVPKESFVATATAVGRIVDLARLPVCISLRSGAVWQRSGRCCSPPRPRSSSARRWAPALSCGFRSSCSAGCLPPCSLSSASPCWSGPPEHPVGPPSRFLNAARHKSYTILIRFPLPFGRSRQRGDDVAGLRLHPADRRLLRPDARLRHRLRASGSEPHRGASPVSLESAVAALTAVGVLVYLLYALIRPERF